MSDRSVHEVRGVTRDGLQQALSDPRLSYRARGILAAVVVQPDRQPHRDWLVATTPETRSDVSVALTELTDLGYRRVSSTKLPDGTWQHTTVWTTTP